MVVRFNVNTTGDLLLSPPLPPSRPVNNNSPSNKRLSCKLNAVQLTPENKEYLKALGFKLKK